MVLVRGGGVGVLTTFVGRWSGENEDGELFSRSILSSRVRLGDGVMPVGDSLVLLRFGDEPSTFGGGKLGSAVFSPSRAVLLMELS